MKIIRIKTILEFPDLPKPFLTFIGFLLVLAIGVLESITSHNIFFSLVYLFPIILIAWYDGGVLVAIISIFSVINSSVSDLVFGHVTSHSATPLWNAITMLGIFLIVGYAITMLKKLLIKERGQAHDDDLASIANISFFYEQARVEISRLAKYKRTLTLVYLSVDNLSGVNEIYGIMAGNYILHKLAQTIKSTLQSTALIARLGEAEIAILMPETENENDTAIIHKVQERLLEMVKKHGWPVTFSTGVVTCAAPTYTIDALMDMAKYLMESAKKTGKNIVKFKVLDLSSNHS